MVTVNKANHSVKVSIDENSMGKAHIIHDSSKIEMVRILEHYGTPHVIPEPDGSSIIMILGALPSTDVTVTYYAE